MPEKQLHGRQIELLMHIKKHLHMVKEADDVIMDVLFARDRSKGVFFSG